MPGQGARADYRVSCGDVVDMPELRNRGEAPLPQVEPG